MFYFYYLLKNLILLISKLVNLIEIINYKLIN